MALVRQLWDGKKTVIIWTVVFMVLGLVAALTMKREYSVSTVMVPQMNSRSNSSLSSLASLAGFDLGMNTSGGGDLSPLVYPQIVGSVPYRLELLYTPLHYEKADTAVSMYTYFKEYTKPSVMGVIKKYTIGLPFTLLGMLQKEKPEVTLPGGEEDSLPKPLVLSKDEDKLLKFIAPKVSLAVDKKEGYITLSVTGSEPVQTAELAMKAQQLLSDEVIRFRTEKSQRELDYIQARYNEIKQEAESYQSAMATITDRSQNMLTSKSRIEMERIRSKYTVANTVYAEMAKQLEQAKMQVKKDTPVMTVIQPVSVPMKPSNSRAKTLIVWVFMGILLGCGLVLGKEYWPKVKEMFAAKPEEE
jgi:uncharacterized protein involved in exopolysaccharide biosynthesis